MILLSQNSTSVNRNRNSQSPEIDQLSAGVVPQRVNNYLTNSAKPSFSGNKATTALSQQFNTISGAEGQQ